MLHDIHPVIVTHHARLEQAKALASVVKGAVSVDRAGMGANWGHSTALAHAGQRLGPALVLEDDAVPAPGAMDGVKAWISAYPDRLISFYLGTGRPMAWQPIIREAIASADRGGYKCIEIPELLHGVAYYVPKDAIGHIVRCMNLDPCGAADFTIGRAWYQLTGTPVIYTLPSLFDHADGPSVEVHPDKEPRTEVRKAWRLPKCH